MALKLYDWDERNNQNQPNIGPKTVNFRLFFIFAETLHTIRTKVCIVILHYFMVFCVQFHQTRMTDIQASQEEKDLSQTFLPHLRF